MAKFANKDLQELAHQLLLSPKRKRLPQIKGIEALLGMVDPSKSYPYAMVCFHITGYRSRRTSDRPAIPGDRLVSDLVLLAEQITRKTAVPMADLDEPHRTYEELADDLKVSTKTVRRWRRRGLMGFRAQSADGIGRLVYLESTIDRFVAQNKALVERGAAFRQLTEAEKSEIVEMAAELLGARRVKLHVVARRISERTGRAVETIRYTLRRYDQAHPERALFTGDGFPSASPLQRRMWQLSQQGESAGGIATACGTSVAEVTRLIREMNARWLKADPVSYVPNELFDAPNADELILAPPRPPEATERARARTPKDLPAYLRSLYDVPLMSPAQEADAFRRYNYLKYKTARLVEALDVCNVRQAELDAVVAMTARYESLRQEIVKANLRLVVSIAKKHVGWSPKFFEVVSDGNMSLLRAVEKFDYARGFKFSTYASWAIMKNYARTVPEEHYHVGRYVTGQDELLDATADHRAPESSALDEQTLTEALQAGMEDLTDRERTIVTSHFGLFGSGPASTLEELGKQFGVTKERIRQIECRAIGKMKSVLSPAVADLLPD